MAAKQAKNLKHILPQSAGLKNKGRPKGTKRREVLHETIAEKQVKKAKIGKKEKERYYHFSAVFTMLNTTCTRK